MKLAIFLGLCLLIAASLPLAAVAEPDQPGAIFTVNSTADPGDGVCTVANCTLREAIITANANGASKDAIHFNIPGAGPHVITLTAALQMISQPLVIDGLTQPGASCAAWPHDLRIVINGSGAGAGVSGLVIAAGNSTVQGVVVQRFSSHGIVLQNGGGNLLNCNYVGTNSGGGIKLGNGGIGVYVNNAPNNVLSRNLISGNGSFGVYVGGANASGNSLTNNRIGTTANGSGALGNAEEGVVLEGAPNTTIGGAAAGDGNLISANGGYGVAVNKGSEGSRLLRNYIGTNVLANAALGNKGAGVSVFGATGIRIGDNVAGAGNVISGNSGAGILVQGNAKNTIIMRNVIGLSQNVSAKVPNTSYGIYLSGGNGSAIGDASNANTIAGNGQDGIFIYGDVSNNNSIFGNFIGTNSTGTSGLGNGMFGVHVSFASGNVIGAAGKGNAIAFNSADGVYIDSDFSQNNTVGANAIFNNGGLGIDLGTDGANPNDAQDPDSGPNLLQNYPALWGSAANESGAVVFGNLNSTPNATFRIEFYVNNSCDGSGYGEGATYLGATTVTTNGSGSANVQAFLAPVAVGKKITATATSATGATSEFSSCSNVEFLPYFSFLPSVRR